MITAALYIGAAVCLLLAIWIVLAETAVEGWEDESGFHRGRKP